MKQKTARAWPSLPSGKTTHTLAVRMCNRRCRLLVLGELTLTGDGQCVPALAAASVDDGAATLGRHTGTKPERAKTRNALRLIRTLGAHRSTPLVDGAEHSNCWCWSGRRNVDFCTMPTQDVPPSRNPVRWGRENHP